MGGAGPSAEEQDNARDMDSATVSARANVGAIAEELEEGDASDTDLGDWTTASFDPYLMDMDIDAADGGEGDEDEASEGVGGRGGLLEVASANASHAGSDKAGTGLVVAA